MSLSEILLEDQVLSPSAQCNHCEATLPENAKFCMECGRKLPAPPPGSAETENNKQLRRVRRLPRGQAANSQNGNVDGANESKSSESHKRPARLNGNATAQTNGRNGKAAPLSAIEVEHNRDSGTAGIDTPPPSEDSADRRTTAFGMQGRGLYSSARTRPSSDETKHGLSAARPPHSVSPPQPSNGSTPNLKVADQADASDLLRRPSLTSDADDPAESVSGNTFDQSVVPEVSDELLASDLSDLLRAPDECRVEGDSADLDTQPPKVDSPSLQDSPTRISAVDDTQDDVDLISDDHTAILPSSDLAEPARQVRSSPQPGADLSGTIPTTSRRRERDIRIIEEPQSESSPAQVSNADSVDANSTYGNSFSQQTEAAQPQVQLPQQAAFPQTISVPIPVPQFVPVPSAEPGQSETPDEHGERSTRTLRLPDPEQTGPEADDKTTDDSDILQLEDAESKNDSAVRTGGSDASTASGVKQANASEPAEKDQMRRRRSAQFQLFRQRAERAKAELLKQQTPIPQKLPRALTWLIAKLEQIKSDRIDELTTQLGLIAATQANGAIDTLRSFAGRRQIPVRLAVAQGLGQIHHETASVALLELLSDAAPEVADEAVRSLLKLRHEQTIGPLLALGVADGRYRAIMRDAIENLDDDQREELVDPLQAELAEIEHPEVAAFALHLLSLIKGEELLKTYTGLIKHDAAEIRVAAIEALSQTGKNRAIRFINAAMKDQAAMVRAAAAAAMSRMTSPNSLSLLINGLQDSEPIVRRSVSKTLTTIEDQQISAAASRALNVETDAIVTQHLLEIVARSGTDDALQTLDRYLASDDRELRHRAIATLRKLRNPRGAKMLMTFLSDPDDDTRRMSVEAMGQLKSKSALPRLRELLQQDSQEQVRAAAARSLGDLQDVESLPLLEEALHDGRSVKCQAVIAMGQIAHKSAVPPLLALLRDQAPEIRYHACHALGEIGDLPNVTPLRDLLDDQEAMVRRGAEAALTKLGHSYQSARWVGRLRKVASSVVPSTIAGAMPGGTAALLAVVAVIAAGIGVAGLQQFSFLAGESFPILAVRAVSVSPNGQQMIVARPERVFEIWDLESGRQTDLFQGPIDAQFAVHASDSTALLTSQDGVYRWDLNDGAATAESSFSKTSIDQVSTVYASLSGDQSRLLTIAPNGNIVISDVAKGQEVSSARIAKFNSESILASTPDTKLVLISSPEGLLRVMKADEGLVLGELDLRRVLDESKLKVSCMAVDRSGRHLAIGTTGGLVITIDLEDGLKIVGRPLEGSAARTGQIKWLVYPRESDAMIILTSKRQIAISPDGVASAKQLTTSLIEVPRTLSSSADGKLLACSSEGSRNVYVIDLAADAVTVSAEPE